MSTILCAVCGARIESTAKICGVCAAPNDAAHSRGIGRLGRPGSDEGGLLVLKIAAAFFGVIVLLGVGAALVIPHLASRAGVPPSAFRGEMTTFEERNEAALALGVAHQAQQWHRERTGRYAADMASLRTMGWTDPMLLSYEFFVAESGGDQLCMEAVPSPQGEDRGAMPLSIDERGVHFAGLGCSGNIFPFEMPHVVGVGS